jgi:hypothetical protein
MIQQNLFEQLEKLNLLQANQSDDD